MVIKKLCEDEVTKEGLVWYGKRKPREVRTGLLLCFNFRRQTQDGRWQTKVEKTMQIVSGVNVRSYPGLEHGISKGMEWKREKKRLC